ncbi:hypothetical protein D3C75_526770 [compost metagenome]
MINSRKPKLIIPITASTRATASCGMLRLNSATANVQALSSNTHSSNEPSCAPQVAATRYHTGNSLLELFATYSTVKSFTTNAFTSTRKLAHSVINNAQANGRDEAIKRESLRATPHSG